MCYVTTVWNSFGGESTGSNISETQINRAEGVALHTQDPTFVTPDGIHEALLDDTIGGFMPENKESNNLSTALRRAKGVMVESSPDGRSSRLRIDTNCSRWIDVSESYSEDEVKSKFKELARKLNILIHARNITAIIIELDSDYVDAEILPRYSLRVFSEGLICKFFCQLDDKVNVINYQSVSHIGSREVLVYCFEKDNLCIETHYGHVKYSNIKSKNVFIDTSILIRGAPTKLIYFDDCRFENIKINEHWREGQPYIWTKKHVENRKKLLNTQLFYKRAFYGMCSMHILYAFILIWRYRSLLI